MLCKYVLPMAYKVLSEVACGRRTKGDVAYYFRGNEHGKKVRRYDMSKMKRFVSAFLSVVMVLMMIPPVEVDAATLITKPKESVTIKCSHLLHWVKRLHGAASLPEMERK